MDLTKIDKARIVEGSSGGKYAKFTLFCDTDKVKDEYGNSGFVSQALNKQDFDNKRNGIELPEMPIIGKAKVVYPKSDAAVEPQNTTPPAKADDSFDDDVPW